MVPPSMRSVRFHKTGAPEVLVYEQVPTPIPGAGEVLVKTRSIGINYAHVMRRRGEHYPVPTPLPFTLGSEAIATVVAVGDGADPALNGQRVIIYTNTGCYSEYAVAQQNRVYPLPDIVADDEAVALFVQGLSAALILRESGRLARGETVLIQGAAGGVGSLAVQLAKLYGAGTVIACASKPAKLALTKDLGADVCVDYTKADWADQVRAATGGRGVDLVLEMTGGEVARRSFDLLAPFGRSVVFGNASDSNWIVDVQSLPPRNISVTGFWLKPYMDNRDLILSTLSDFWALLAEKRIRVEIGGRYALSEATKAHHDIEARLTTGKLVLIPEGVSA